MLVSIRHVYSDKGRDVATTRVATPVVRGTASTSPMLLARVRTISWVTILSDESPVVEVLQFLQIAPSGRVLATAPAGLVVQVPKDLRRLGELFCDRARVLRGRAAAGAGDVQEAVGAGLLLAGEFDETAQATKLSRSFKSPLTT